MLAWLRSPASLEGFTSSSLGRHKKRLASYGKLNFISLLYLWFRKVPTFYWSLDTRDTWPAQGLNCKRINVHVKETGGAVTLAHDFDRTTDDVDNMVLDSVRSVLLAARRAGMSVVTISELLGAD